MRNQILRAQMAYKINSEILSLHITISDNLLKKPFIIGNIYIHTKMDKNWKALWFWSIWIWQNIKIIMKTTYLTNSVLQKYLSKNTSLNGD